MTVIDPRATEDRSRTLGQSLVEFALVLPVLLVIVMMGLDFGRVFLGWVNLNNTARIAANYAATTATQFATGSGPLYDAAFDNYYALVQRDAQSINCALPPKGSFPPPSYPSGTSLGQPAHVEITCRFGLLTPIISNILGTPINVSASSDFPIRTGIIAGTPTGGGGSGVTASFNISPTGGVAGVTVNFTDTSTGSPTSYQWDFDGDGSVDSTVANGNSFQYTMPGSYVAKLTVSDGLSTDSFTRTINISAPPGPVVNFTATPASGPDPLHVTFTNSSTGSGTLTYLWDLGDGSPTVTTLVPSPHDYGPGTWIVKLTVTDGFGTSNSATKTITVSTLQCTVPDFVGLSTAANIQGLWSGAGFTTSVIFQPIAPPDYTIKKQQLKKNTQQACHTAVQTVFLK
jgi:PKD repeat protein